MKILRVLFCVALALGAYSACAQKITNEVAPPTYRVNVDTSRGPVVIEVTRADAPIGADRFYNLVKAKYFDGARFFRVIPGFMAQFGLAADPALTRRWDVPIQDDPVKSSNVRGTVTFAATGSPNSRSTQLFINYADNSRLDSQRFAPFGKVVSGMENVDQIYSGDRENPDQQRIQGEGNAYLEKAFPNLDYIKTARIAQ
ncbi:MAG: peptidylprolyl isomerase [Acidobacteriota bacterium]|nr:peptidylprolyl isomerase [Acidobacteriota bacterium]